MKYYILDDDINIVKILLKIIEEDFQRTVIGYNTNPEIGIKEINNLKPDIVLIDYLMPNKDGSDVLKEINSFHSNLECIMVSQISDKAMVEEAYRNGLSNFINKPINKIEVNVVLSKIEERLKTQAKLNQIYSVFGDWRKPDIEQAPPIKRINEILRDIGIYSEKGARDILAVTDILIQNRNMTVKDATTMYCNQSPDVTKIIHQRMRRAIYKGLRNIAHLGIEDNLNANYMKYSTQLFGFETVKNEMDAIRGNRQVKGSISLERFLKSLVEINV